MRIAVPMGSRTRSRVKILAFVSLILVVAGCSGHADTPSNPPVDTPAIVQALQQFVDDGTIPGAVVLVASKDAILDVVPVGYADITSKSPVTSSSMFWIASMSKAMTCAAFMTLVDQAKVGLDDPVYKYLPEFANDKAWPIVPAKNDTNTQPLGPTNHITIRQLMSHTAGMHFISPYEAPTIDTHTLAERVSHYVTEPLLFDPGAEYSYANEDINSAARIIEVVTGKSFADYLKQSILQPLNMADTAFVPSPAQVARIVPSYRYDTATNALKSMPIGYLKYPLDDPTRQPVPAGGLFSTANDVARFCQMLLRGGTDAKGNRILSLEAVNAMSTKQTGPLVKTGYGFGLSIGRNSFGHGGAYSTNMTVDTKRALITVLMVQMAGWKPEAQAKFNQALDQELAKYPSQP